MTNTTFSLNETAWQYACDKANVAAAVSWNAEQARKPEGERADFVPETWQAYAARIITSTEASYMAQMIADNIQFIAQQHPDDIARMRKSAELPDAERDALRQQIDAIAS